MRGSDSVYAAASQFCGLNGNFAFSYLRVCLNPLFRNKTAIVRLDGVNDHREGPEAEELESEKFDGFRAVAPRCTR